MLQDLLSAHKPSFKDYTELRAQVNSTQRVVMQAGNMVANNQESAGGVSARVYRGGTYGFASAATYSHDGVKNVLAAATSNAMFMDASIAKGKPPLLSAASGKQSLVKTPGDAIPQSVIVDYAKELDELIIKNYKNLSSRQIIVSCLDIEKLLVVADGTDSHSYQPTSYIYVFMTAEAPDGVPVELARPIGTMGRFTELFTDPTLITADLDRLYEALMKKREGVYARAGQHKCVLGMEMAGMLAHEAIGHTVEADSVLTGSVAAHNLNKEVASPLVSMVDYAHTALGKPCVLPVYVDDEGVQAEDAVLIDKGILKGFMHSRETAQHFGVAPQGNARAFEFSDEPLIRMRNTAILPGTSKLEDMISSLDDGYYLLTSYNGQADSTGEFMFAVNEGYEVKNGKIGSAIRESTISGVAFEMLKTVDMVSGDMFWESAGFCGKKQAMTVSCGGPALRCDINLGGR